ncbi:MAG: hypothetical protein WAN81_09085 [Candidatus Binataceae bacterium]
MKAAVKPASSTTAGASAPTSVSCPKGYGEPRERVIKQALFGILKSVAEVERIFPILKAQSEY